MKTETITKSNNLTLDFLLTDNQSGSLNQVKPTGILDLFQTIAGAHAAVLGVSMTDLMKNGKCWVLESVQYDVIKPADPHERVYVETRFQIPGKLFYVRDYVIKSANGEVLEIKSVQDGEFTFVEGSVFGERRFVAKLQF